jgi:choline dehydrogenase-like flavoprotein
MSYDAVIVGSGFGGAFAALALTEAGLRVLLLERGQPVARDDGDWDPQQILLGARYRSKAPVQIRQYGAQAYLDTHHHEVFGGGSVFYGGASLRMRPQDLQAWPLVYDDLEAHYTRAEGLLDVHGLAGGDPFEPPRSAPYPRTPIDLTSPAQRIHTAAQSLGYRPFALPLAINFRDASRPLCILCNTCDGHPCRIEAKNDLTATVLHRAQVLGLEIRVGVIARQLVVDAGQVTAIEATDAVSGASHTFAASRFVVAAGALQTPALLLRSGLGETTQGGRWIGRRLMRHCNAVLTGVFRERTNPEGVFHKQLCFTDFYEDLRSSHGMATGTIQDIYTPIGQVIAHHAPPGLRTIAGWCSMFMQNLLCVAEDEPRYENSVRLGREDCFGMASPRVDHAYTEADYQRRNHLLAHARQVLKAAGAWTTRVHEIDSFSHGVGTVGMAGSPEAGASDSQGRLWGVENLWITDGAAFTTSGGVNPSLTIAANALRVAPFIIKGRR